MTKEIMDKAGLTPAPARILLTAGDSDGATNRAYYAMFDAAIAALAWAGIALPKPDAELIELRLKRARILDAED